VQVRFGGDLVKNAGALGWSDVESSEAALITRCTNYDQAACAELVSAHQPMVYGLALNLLGAVSTGVVLLIIAVMKFFEGAWMVVVAVPLVMGVFWATRRHYFQSTMQLSLSGAERPRIARHTVIVPRVTWTCVRDDLAGSRAALHVE